MVTSLSNLFEEVVGLSNNLLDRNYKFCVDCVKWKFVDDLLRKGVPTVGKR